MLVEAWQRAATKRPHGAPQAEGAKRKDQVGQCARCHKPLPDKYTVIDRLVAAKGYTTENTPLIFEKCDREVQTERRYT